MYDAGILTVYGITTTEGKSVPPVSTLQLKAMLPYELRIVGASRYYEAAKAGMRIDKTVRIGVGVEIVTEDIAFDGRTYYIIRKITPKPDGDGLPVLELDLEAQDKQIRARFGVTA